MHYIFDRTKTLTDEAIAAAEQARKEWIAELDWLTADLTKKLESAKEQARTLPETLGKLSAERARLEATTGAAIVAEMIKPAQQEPAAEPTTEEPFVPGLPDERLRAVWAEWEDEDGDRLVFSQNTFWCSAWVKPFDKPEPYEGSSLNNAKFRPHGTTWANVRRLADEAEKAKATPFGMPTVDQVLAEKGAREELERKAKAQPEAPADPALPELLDLRTLPVGTVCEAVGECQLQGGGVIPTGERFVITLQEPPEYMGAIPTAVKIPIGTIRWLSAMQPARVVSHPAAPLKVGDRVEVGERVVSVTGNSVGPGQYVVFFDYLDGDIGIDKDGAHFVVRASDVRRV